jgi:hypothetical protein
VLRTVQQTSSRAQTLSVTVSSNDIGIFISTPLFTDESKLGILLRFSLQWLRSLFVPPVIIILALILGSVLAGLGIVYSTLTSHLRGDLICFEDQYVEFGFPKNWYGGSSEVVNSTSGNSYAALFIAPNEYLDLGLTVYDRNATKTFMKDFNLTDSRSVTAFLANNTYHYFLKTSSNATLTLNCSSTIQVSGTTADYSIYLVKDAYLDTTDNVTKSIKLMIISYIDSQQRLVQIILWGNQDDFENSLQMFETTVLSQLRVKA